MWLLLTAGLLLGIPALAGVPLAILTTFLPDLSTLVIVTLVVEGMVAALKTTVALRLRAAR
jgi:hypothetical protein